VHYNLTGILHPIKNIWFRMTDSIFAGVPCRRLLRERVKDFCGRGDF